MCVSGVTHFRADVPRLILIYYDLILFKIESISGRTETIAYLRSKANISQ